MARTDTLPHFLTDVADAIRTKTGTSETIQASTFDTAISNIPSGSATPTTISELNDAIVDLAESFVDYLGTLPNTYSVYTNDPVTLYTPNASFPYYAIQKRSSGKYRVIWTSTNLILFYSDGIRNWYWYERFTQNGSQDVSQIFNSNGTVGIGYNDTGDYYYSDEYNTANECVEKMLNNELVYSYISGAYLGAIEDTPYIIPYSNAPIMKFISNNSDPEIKMSQRISQNETIQVIQ